ncbi:uncharacterized protein [Apteryx mantelli]|uniref:Uncharacterized protein isoform X2 n=1 Tax=Apteryx mantelli TaxID=2696672 RepID=A0ABM4F1F1_9AVES
MGQESQDKCRQARGAARDATGASQRVPLSPLAAPGGAKPAACAWPEPLGVSAEVLPAKQPASCSACLCPWHHLLEPRLQICPRLEPVGSRGAGCPSRRKSLGMRGCVVSQKTLKKKSQRLCPWSEAPGMRLHLSKAMKEIRPHPSAPRQRLTQASPLARTPRLAADGPCCTAQRSGLCAELSPAAVSHSSERDGARTQGPQDHAGQQQQELRQQRRDVGGGRRLRTSRLAPALSAATPPERSPRSCPVLRSRARGAAQHQLGQPGGSCFPCSAGAGGQRNRASCTAEALAARARDGPALRPAVLQHEDTSS